MCVTNDRSILISSTGRVVAEGVETAVGWDLLAGLDCDVAQGFYLSRPMPAEDVPRWIRDWASRHEPRHLPSMISRHPPGSTPPFPLLEHFGPKGPDLRHGDVGSFGE